MRIIGGKHKGRKFDPPAGKWPTRPTTDFAKEGLFNILTNAFDFSEIKVLDLFGGTGSITYELLSRGCTQITYVDQYYPCIAFVKKTKKFWEPRRRSWF
jgi:16S rRNA (guanine966-N2)-methyltransferase